MHLARWIGLLFVGAMEKHTAMPVQLLMLELKNIRRANVSNMVYYNSRMLSEIPEKSESLSRTQCVTTITLSSLSERSPGKPHNTRNDVMSCCSDSTSTRVGGKYDVSETNSLKYLDHYFRIIVSAISDNSGKFQYQNDGTDYI